MRMEAFQKIFFDRAKITASIDAATLKNLRYAGGYIRRVAVNSIKAAPYGKVAPPGAPPLDHHSAMRRWANRKNKKKGLKPKKIVGYDNGIRNILFGFDTIARSLVVGPVGQVIYGKRTVPDVLERGGTGTDSKGRPIQVAPHPFMAPALAKAQQDDRFVGIWKNSVKG